ncbi:DUF3267 domain-containing protein [Metabacillus herbersteinensis]|uniref:DUF3267 domain-containing protein n=1 Tax=Metabacillus herbersteinensis TaxID=283816 RepID=A0ABV6GFV7_9BACI
MNCWKTINLSKDFGLHRIYIFSMLTMIITFIIIYLPIHFVYPQVEFKEGQFFFFILVLVTLIPIHKLFHVLPLILSGNRVNFRVKYLTFIPSLQIKACYSIKKSSMLCSLLFPLLFITPLLVIAGTSFLPYIHYFCILIAYHIGMCVPDLIFAKLILQAPKTSYIEEFEDGFEILVHKSIP